MDQRLIKPYLESARRIIYEMTGIKISIVGGVKADADEFGSYGIASVLTFAGKIKGRLVIDISPELAKQMYFNMMEEKQDNIKDRMLLATISEMNNTIAGDANTKLNNEYNLSLRLAPPIVFSGQKILVATAKIKSVIVECKTEYGNLRLNLAFVGGIDNE